MRRLLLLILTTLIGLLFIAPGGFAKSLKPKRTTIKYENGAKYVGEIDKRPKRYAKDPMLQFVIRNDKVKHGKGIMYFANGDQLDGTWVDDQCRYGTYKFADGNIFEGEMNHSRMIHDGSMDFSCDRGTMTFAFEGEIVLGDKKWHYPAGACFFGTIKDKIRPRTGIFHCVLINEEGDRYTGRLFEGHLDNGKLEYADGDTFEGNFISDAPSKGKYCYRDVSEIVKADCRWKVPAGCIFEGDIAAFTGSVNMEVVDSVGNRFIGKFNNGKAVEGRYKAEKAMEKGRWTLPAGCVFEGDIVTFTGSVDTEIADMVGNRFIGKLKNGEPDEGTMRRANGKCETGTWHEGMAPSEYKIYLAKREAERKRKEILDNQRALRRFEKHWAANHKWDGWDRDKELCRGASLKLNQIFAGRDVEFNDSEIYKCKKIECDTTNQRIVIIREKNGVADSLYIHAIDEEKYEYNYPFPRELARKTYIRCHVGDFVREKIRSKLHLYFVCSKMHRVITERDYEMERRRVRDYFMRKFGDYYGTAIMNREIKLGMTIEMVQAIKGNGEISRYVSNGREITTLSYGGVRNALIATIVSPTDTYTFVNGKLTDYTIHEGQGTVIWN